MRAAPAARVTLPVSGAAVVLQQPTGAEDLLLAEHRADDPALALALIERLAETEAALAWRDLPAHDADVLIVRLRQWSRGDRVVADIACASPGCRQRIDLSFSLEAYLAHHRPRPARGRSWRLAAGDSWHALVVAGAEAARFRLPTLGDQVAVYGLANPAAALAARCIEPADLSARTRGRVEAAMAAMAPPLAGPLQGRCPDCGAPIAARFEARQYCLQELREHASFVLDDVDVLAERYHWSERAILAMPQARRTGYAERARRAMTG